MRPVIRAIAWAFMIVVVPFVAGAIISITYEVPHLAGVVSLALLLCSVGAYIWLDLRAFRRRLREEEEQFQAQLNEMRARHRMTFHHGDPAVARSASSIRRARALLQRCLNPEQLRQYEQHGAFMVCERERGDFIILPRLTFNVIHLKTGNLYCATADHFVPVEDLMLAQKLLLENDPDRFFRVANCRPETFAGPGEQALRQALRAEASSLDSSTMTYVRRNHANQPSVQAAA